MSRMKFRVLCLALLAGIFLLAGCSDFEEMKGLRLLAQGEALLGQGNQEQGEAVLAELVERYPATQAADLGRAQLEVFRLVRDKREVQSFSEVLNSFRQVLDGYLAVYGEYPRSISALDGSGYFFDSDYLTEAVPEGTQVFLSLQPDGAGYGIWSVQDSSVRGYAFGSADARMTSFEKEPTLAGLKERFQSGGWQGKVVVLAPRP